jgi:thiaminase/transcriptional activator TenA
VSVHSDPPWSAQLWRLMEPIYDEIRQHPFLTGLSDGTLAPDAFARYLRQDGHYLRDYARVLAVLGAKAPTGADAALLARHSAATAEVELAGNDALLAELGATADADVTPTTRAYTSYLLATAYGGSFAEGLAAVLPCYWIYARVGTALAADGSPRPAYRQWINTYAGKEFAVLVNEVVELVDRVGPQLGALEKERAQQHLVVATRYEWMFWDAAYTGERWRR